MRTSLENMLSKLTDVVTEWCLEDGLRVVIKFSTGYNWRELKKNGLSPLKKHNVSFPYHEYDELCNELRREIIDD